MESSILPELCRVLAVHPSISGVQEAAIDACGSLLLQQPCAGLREIANEGLISDLLARMQVAFLSKNPSGPTGSIVMPSPLWGARASNRSLSAPNRCGESVHLGA